MYCFPVSIKLESRAPLGPMCPPPLRPRTGHLFYPRGQKHIINSSLITGSFSKAHSPPSQTQTERSVRHRCPALRILLDQENVNMVRLTVRSSSILIISLILVSESLTVCGFWSLESPTEP